MSNNELIGNEIMLPNNAEDRKKIKDAIEEMVVAIIAVADKQSYIGDVKKMLKEDYSIPPTVSGKAAALIAKHKIEEESEKNQTIRELCELVQG